jgi:hypothetical protein
MLRLFIQGVSRRRTVWVVTVVLTVAGCVFKITDPLAPSLRGSVTSEVGSPLEGVEVSIPEQGLSTRTDSGGQFRLDELPQSEFDLTVSAARRSTVTMDRLELGVEYSLLALLDAYGEVSSLELRSPTGSNGIQGVLHALTRPEGASISTARGVIDAEEFVDGGQELTLELERMAASSVYDVAVIGEDAEDLGILGSVDTDHVGTGVFEYEVPPEKANVALASKKASLSGKKIKVQGKRSQAVELRGMARLSRHGRARAAAPLDTTGVDDNASGLIKIKGTPPGQFRSSARREMDYFKIEVAGLQPGRTYDVCIARSSDVACPPDDDGGDKPSSAPYEPSTASTDKPVLILGPAEPVVIGGETFVDVPVSLRTVSMSYIGFQFTVDYSNSCLDYDSCRRGSGFPTEEEVENSVLECRQLPGANNPGTDTHVVAIAQIPFPEDAIPPPDQLTGDPVTVEVAVIRFKQLGDSCILLWDQTNTDATSVVNSLFDLIGPSAILFEPDDGLMIEFICGQIRTNDSGKGKLKLRQPKDELPGEAACVNQLAGNVVLIRGTEGLVLTGKVPPLSSGKQ